MIDRLLDDLARHVANALPGRVLYWATVRAGVVVTTGVYSDTVVPDLTLVDAIRRVRLEVGA